MPVLEAFFAGPYNVALTCAVAFGMVLALRAGKSSGLPSLGWAVLLTAALASGFIGSKFIFLDFHAPRLGEKSNLGALVAGITTAVLCARWLRIGATRALDSMTVPSLVAMAIGRIGCFLTGCCAGTETTLPWGVHVDDNAAAIHPVQLYESLLDMLLVTAIMRWVPGRKPGQRIGVAVVSYAGIRFATEFVRAGRTSVFGLNVVQWSVLAIGLATGVWLWYRSRLAVSRDEDVVASVLVPAAHAEQRAFAAAMLLGAAVLCIVFGFSYAFEPFEALFLITIACGIAAYALLRNSPVWVRRPLMPSLAVLFFFQSPGDPVKQKSEVVIGGGLWNGSYQTLVGRMIEMYTNCDGSPGTSSIPTYAFRRSRSGWLSGGIRQRLSSGTRIMVEGKFLGGNDKLKELNAGPLDAPVANEVATRAYGGAVTIEKKNSQLQVEALGGTLSRAGEKQHGVTGSVTGRIGSESGLFLEGHFAPTQWYASTGDLSYGGFGFVMNPQGLRVMFGGGLGVTASVHVPLRSFELDVIARAPTGMGRIEKPQGTMSIGLKKAFTIR